MITDDSIRREQAAWKEGGALDYYRTRRSSPADLYDSERFFLPEVLQRVRSVLDVGCAAGGFSRIMRGFNPSVRYVGVDITPELIAAAQDAYPDCEFQLSDGVHFPFPSQSFDLVHCSGVLHLNSHYQDIVHAMWDQTGRFLLCDFRLTRGSEVTGEIRVDLGGNAVSSGMLPYYVLNVEELVGFLKRLTPPPATIRAKGYPHTVSPAAHLPLEGVIMAFFLLEKGNSSQACTELTLDFSS